MKNIIKICFLILVLTISSTSCAQDGMHYGAKETFTYWAGEEPWEGIEVINGQYWSSAHWTKEYILYMEVKVPIEMALTFITDNKLEATNDDVKFPKDAPEWFNPPKDFKEYKTGIQGSKYFINTETGHLFIYEVQL